jgi:drug/metabolite transporter (DMT)-like permease
MSSRSQSIPILLNLAAAFLGAVGQYLYKVGARDLGRVPLPRNFALWGGMLLFCGVMVLFVAAFRLGGRLSVVYPAYATTFLWATLIAVRVEREPLTPGQILGIGLVILGVSLVAVSARA